MSASLIGHSGSSTFQTIHLCGVDGAMGGSRRVISFAPSLTAHGPSLAISLRLRWPVHGLDRGLHVQEPLTRLFGLAALVGTGGHFNQRSALLDQSRSPLFQIVGVLFRHT